MAEAEFSLLPRRLFGDRPSGRSGSDDSLEASPVLPRLTPGASRFSPHNLNNLAHHSASRPATPKGAATTPLNARQHRPPHTAGPKPNQYVEPSPTTQRISEPRLPMSRRFEQVVVPTTPSRTRHGADSPIAALPVSANASASGADARTGGMTLSEEPARSASNSALQSLPKKKHRVSRTEIAIAHEEAGAGPIASPSPRKMADYFAPPAEQGGPGFGLAQTRLRSDSISDRQQSATALRNLTDLAPKQPSNSLTLSKSGLFLGVVARPLPGWSVYEDSVLSSDTAPSQDHAPAGSDAATATTSPVSSPLQSPANQSIPSTPNKENRVPDAGFLASKTVPVALPDRAYSVDAVPTKTRSSSRLASAAASPVAPASRKRGTGGRLSLLADAEDDDANRDASQYLKGDGTLAETTTASGKKLRSKGSTLCNPASPVNGTRKASSHQRKASAGRGLDSSRTSRKASSTLAGGSPQRGLDAAVAVDAVASRTRSRTRV